ncbi:MAG: hypothetical protein IJ656_03205 [Bacilli bacterium]|nr:hypothetical protein [Bacilli bacterium]MBR1582020.1 hypothetical protein [Bacilli bacterium]
MRLNKSQALLFIYETLMKNRRITKSEVQDVLDIPDLTFRRYMQEIRAYLYNFYKTEELKYSKKCGYYYLTEE